MPLQLPGIVRLYWEMLLGLERLKVFIVKRVARVPLRLVYVSSRSVSYLLISIESTVEFRKVNSSV
jgi:hypothetical protein